MKIMKAHQILRLTILVSFCLTLVSCIGTSTERLAQEIQEDILQTLEKCNIKLGELILDLSLAQKNENEYSGMMVFDEEFNIITGGRVKLFVNVFVSKNGFYYEVESDNAFVNIELTVCFASLKMNEGKSRNDLNSNVSVTKNLELDNIITNYSIAGVHIIGNTFDKVKSEFGQKFTWKITKDQTAERDGYYIASCLKNGKVIFKFDVGYYDESEDVICDVITNAQIYSPDFVSEEGLRVGSTVNDLLKVYLDDSKFGFTEEFVRYPWHDSEIGYYFEKHDFERVNGTMVIKNKNARIKYISIDKGCWL